MATEIMNKTPSQPSLYDPVNRTVDYWFDIPEGGVNKDTGIMLFICGYGATSQSNVFKKMRSLFADRYNMITVQCNYFGLEYMWVPEKEDAIRFLSDYFGYGSVVDSTRDKSFYWIVRQDETPASLNDMGPVQAMDNLTVLHSLDSFLTANDLVYDRSKIVAFGNSHGAYLAELCNSYMPGVFSAIIDIGGYIYPYYLPMDDCREVIWRIPELKTEVRALFDDLIKHIVMDEEIYDLNALYTQECSRAIIIAFHGVDDFLTSYVKKRDYIEKSANWVFNLITQNDVDGEIFSNHQHSLGANFIKLIENVFENYSLSAGEERMFFGNTVFETDTAIYDIGVRGGRPDIKYKLTGSYDTEEMKMIVRNRPETELVSG